jgi:hypothetical protein
LFFQLKQIQQAAGVAEPNAPMTPSSSSADPWDDLAFDPVLMDAESTQPHIQPVPPQPTRNTPDDGRPLPIEDQMIAMCSNGNISMTYKALEIKYRSRMAGEQLCHIRNLIAEKSFQFSHVIRVSPRKSVTTRARAAVKKLNNQIAEHCRCYARCRASLMVLGAEESILSRFKVLNPVDIVGSTVILNPNEPGSTRVKLSWIWQSSATNILTYTGQTTRDMAESMDSLADDPASVSECMFILMILYISSI